MQYIFGVSLNAGVFAFIIRSAAPDLVPAFHPTVTLVYHVTFVAGFVSGLDGADIIYSRNILCSSRTVAFDAVADTGIIFTDAGPAFKMAMFPALIEEDATGITARLFDRLRVGNILFGRNIFLCLNAVVHT